MPTFMTGPSVVFGPWLLEANRDVVRSSSSSSPLRSRAVVKEVPGRRSFDGDGPAGNRVSEPTGSAAVTPPQWDGYCAT
jgi:hypothetical protein